MVLSPGGANLHAVDPIDPSPAPVIGVAPVAGSADPLTLTSNPSIRPGSAPGQVMRLFNPGTTAVTLDSTKGMHLDEPFVTLDSRGSVDFYWDGFIWNQASPVTHGSNGAYTYVTAATPVTINRWDKHVSLSGGGQTLDLSKTTSSRPA